MVYQFLLFRVFALACTIVFIACNKKVPHTSPQVRDITEAVYAAGVIKSEDQYEVFSTVTGIISAIPVVENDTVKKGDLLLLIADETPQLASKSAAITSAYSDVSTNRDKLNDLSNTIVLAEQKYRNDSLLFQRQQNLWNQGIGTRIELEQKELTSHNSKTALESAKIRYNDLLRELQYNAALSRNNLAISKYKERDYSIRSEMDGKVYAVLKKVGELVNPQTPLAIVGDVNRFVLELQVDEHDIVKITQDQVVVLTMDSYKNEVFEARITKINPLMNQSSRTFTSEAVFTKAPPVLYPNLTVEANIVIREKKQALIIPRNYLLNDSMVLMEKDKPKTIVTGLKDYQNVEVVNGLSANDIIYKPAP